MAIKTEFISSSAGFTSESYDQSAPVNAMILDSENVWFNPNGELEVCGGTKKSEMSIAGDVAFLFGDGYGTIGTGAGTGKGNAAKYIGNIAVLVTNDDVNIYDPSLGVDPFVIPFAGATGVAPYISTSPLQDGVPYIVPYNPITGVYQTPVPIGLLAQEDALELIQPISTSADLKGILNGLYALKISYNRPDTGGESLASPSSNSIQLTNSSVVTRFPLPTTPRYTQNSPLAWDTNDFWKIYSTPVNYGNTTVFLFLKEIRERRLATEDYTNWTAVAGSGITTITLTAEKLTYLYTVAELNSWLVGKTVVAGSETGIITEVTSDQVIKINTEFVATSGSALQISSLVSGFSEERLYETEWTENDLSGDVPSTNFYSPYTTDKFFSDDFTDICKFVVPLNNVMLLIGTDGGNGIRVSLPNYIEAYPPNYALNLPETPIGVSYRAEDGYCYVLCKNSIHEIRWTGAVDGAPVVVRTISTNIGTASQKSFFTLNGIIYCFTSNNRIVRVSPSGEYDYEFSTPVVPYTKNWDHTKVCTAYDEKRNAVCFFHEREFITFHLDLKAWSAPINFDNFETSVDIPDGHINTAITYRGVIHLFDEGISDTFLLDRDLTGVEALNASSAVVKFQHNHLNEEIWFKNIIQAQIIGTALSDSEVTVGFYSDFRSSASGAVRTAVFRTGEKISNIVSCNNGVGRLISVKLTIDSAIRAIIHTLRLDFTTTRMRVNS